MRRRFGLLSYRYEASPCRSVHREDSAAIADAGRVIFELYDRFVYLRAYVWMGRRDKVAQSLNRLICLLERIYSSKSVAPYSTTSSSRRSGEITY